jgi:hypothetical protein
MMVTLKVIVVDRPVASVAVESPETGADRARDGQGVDDRGLAQREAGGTVVDAPEGRLALTVTTGQCDGGLAGGRFPGSAEVTVVVASRSAGA